MNFWWADIQRQSVEIGVRGGSFQRLVTKGLRSLGTFQDTGTFRGDQHDLMGDVRGSRQFFSVLHDQLVVAGQQVPPAKSSE